MHLAPAGCSQDLAKMIEGLKSGGNIEDHSEFCSAFLNLATGLRWFEMVLRAQGISQQG